VAQTYITKDCIILLLSVLEISRRHIWIVCGLHAAWPGFDSQHPGWHWGLFSLLSNGYQGGGGVTPGKAAKFTLMFCSRGNMWRAMKSDEKDLYMNKANEVQKYSGK
jgi:hypothetical protein